jgi:hypothetical protein
VKTGARRHHRGCGPEEGTASHAPRGVVFSPFRRIRGRRLPPDKGGATADLPYGDGSVFLLRPTSSTSTAWIEEFAADAKWFGGAVAVEHRFIADIVCRAIGAGLRVR